jgi:photosystem II stability/assembly factor-like uncharacterized protein
MKNFILILVMVITGLVMNSSYAQGRWSLQTNPLGIGDAAMLGKIQFVSQTEGWIDVSWSANLLHTVNSGTNWTVESLSQSDVVWSLPEISLNMCFVNTSTGWVIKSLGTSGEDSHGGVIYKTKNGGLNWQRIILSENAGDVAMQIQFADTNNGWASIINSDTGVFTLFKSTDGGDNWIQVPNTIPVFTGFVFRFIDSNNGWAIQAEFNNIFLTEYTILHTSDGGANWSQQYINFGDSEPNDILFTDPNNGWIVGTNGAIFKTTNGGLNWVLLTNTGLTNDHNPISAYFMNATSGWVGVSTIADYSFILHTTDGGASWNKQNAFLYNYEDINCLFFWNENNGWLTASNGKIGHYFNPLGINENIINKSISIYPNPTNGKFCINLKEPKSKMEVEIYNVLGQKIYESSTHFPFPINEINFAPQSKGVYLIKINDGENNYTEKILIQ